VIRWLARASQPANSNNHFPTYPRSIDNAHCVNVMFFRSAASFSLSHVSWSTLPRDLTGVSNLSPFFLGGRPLRLVIPYFHKVTKGLPCPVPCAISHFLLLPWHHPKNRDDMQRTLVVKSLERLCLNIHQTHPRTQPSRFCCVLSFRFPFVFRCLPCLYSTLSAFRVNTRKSDCRNYFRRGHREQQGIERPATST